MAAGRIPRESGAPAPKRAAALRTYLWTVVAAVVATLAAGGVASPEVGRKVVVASPWLIALFLAELYPFPLWRDLRISLGYPLLVFLGALFDPITVGILAFVGTGDPREIGGGSDLLRSLFNRAQVAAAGMAASLVFHLIEPQGLGPAAIGAATAAGVAHMAVNIALVGTAARLDYRVPLRRLVPGMLVGGRWTLQLSYVTLGLLGGVMALVYREVGPWALVGLFPPLIAFRYLLNVVRESERAEAQRRLAAERREDVLGRERERRRQLQEMAAFLHDEIVPELTAAGLLIENADRLARDGRPEAGEHVTLAAQTAQTARIRVRSLIGDLLGERDAGSLEDILRELCREMEEESGAKIHLDLAPVALTGAAQGVLFSVAREAARNAARHGEADAVRIALRRDGSHVVLIVADDGRGFDPQSVNGGGYGLSLMRRRVENIEGQFTVESIPGEGTTVTCRIRLAAAGDAYADGDPGLTAFR